MSQNQKRLNVNVSFENELAQYLTDMAEMQNKTIQKVLVDFVKEEFEEDIALSKIADERDVPGAKMIKGEDVDWDKILFTKTTKDEDIN